MLERYIPDSPGLSRPKHMDDEEWAEYSFSEEARVELTYVPNEYDYYDDIEDSYWDAMAEETESEMDKYTCPECGNDQHEYLSAMQWGLNQYSIYEDNGQHILSFDEPLEVWEPAVELTCEVCGHVWTQMELHVA